MNIQKYIARMAILAVIFGLLLAGSNASAMKIQNGTLVEKLDAFYASQITSNNLKGMAVIIVNQDQVLYQRAFGMAGEGIPFTPQTPFPISSGSKSFLAMAVMQLVDSGKVELDAPIQKYLPWWRVADAQLSAQITVRDLLNMATGLVAGPGFFDDPSMSNRLPVDTSMEEAVRDLQTARPRLPLRTGFLYFDANYWTLAVLVEKIAGQVYPQYLKEKIFDPLRMKNSATTAEETPGMAQGNLTFFGFPLSYSETITQKYLVGCCGVVSTAEDLSRYLIAQLNDGQNGSTRLVSAESMHLMHTPLGGVEGFMGSQYGMGWFVEEEDGIKLLSDPGTWATYSSEMTLLPEQGYAFAILINQGCVAPQLIGFPSILSGTIRLLTGRDPEGGISLQIYGVILAGLALLTIGEEIFALVRLSWGAAKARNFPAWRKILDIAVPVVEAGLLSIGFPYLFAIVGAKTFDLKIALLWWTDLAVYLFVLSILLLIKAAIRCWILIQPCRKLHVVEEEI